MARRPLDIAWLDDGRAGHANQALGLAEALARLRPASISRVLAPTRPRLFPFVENRADPDIAARDLLIACGRRTTGPARLCATLNAPRPFIVHIQDPRRARRDFDLILAPRHDGLKGDNVVSLIGGPHRVRLTDCEADAALLAADIALPEPPYCAFLFGGGTKTAKLGARRIDRWIDAARSVRDAGFGLLITASRRTGPHGAALLREALGGPGALFWNGGPLGRLANPYRAFLALADHIVVTDDSAAMAVEAASTGRPVHLLAGPDGRRKFVRLADDLIRHGAARPFAPPPWRVWRYAPLAETERAAHEVLRRYEIWERAAT